MGDSTGCTTATPSHPILKSKDAKFEEFCRRYYVLQLSESFRTMFWHFGSSSVTSAIDFALTYADMIGLCSLTNVWIPSSSKGGLA